MKTLLFYFFIGFAAPLAAQGIAIANDIKTYLQAKKVEGLEQIEGRVPANPPAHRIGGQLVDEAHSVVFKAFRQHPEWQSVVLVADWTASMYPYLGQVLAWHELNADKQLVSELFLFNDGDDALFPNRSKTVGKTGGIYAVNPNDSTALFETMAKAVDNGQGHDSEENDVEALLFAQQRHPQADYLVLIADNSPVRDLSLLPQLQKPVHIVLCNDGWVYDYVKIAYETGGSITLLADQLDFSDKSKVDPQQIWLGGMRYSLR